MDKNLTPEEIVKKYSIVVPGNGSYLTPVLGCIAVREYANQEGAEKDERIAELEQWKKEAMEVSKPLFDYACSGKCDIPLGKSIYVAASEALKSQKEKDERIKELEERLSPLLCGWCDGKGQVGKMTLEGGEGFECEHCKGYGNDKDARIAELEADVKMHKSECEQLTIKSKGQKARISDLEMKLSHSDGCRKNEQSLYEEGHKQLLEKVERLEKDGQDMRACRQIDTKNLLEAYKARDQSLGQLDKWETFKGQLASYLMECDYKCTGREISDFIDEFSPLLPSRENKKQDE